ncbi:DNA mismatch repair protein Mlh1 isoform X2 [Ceratina calcarata]|uniref:DNA mismatch repair protein Mlh1 isoform X2 n=2 Tax=Ceratina calcarata TaxID=156304 RepID=A0AAJ7WF48_9HYME|nr:DNA mismatch repair protein Mlh1 isoform X2 [Ceratina calcarata]
MQDRYATLWERQRHRYVLIKYRKCWNVQADSDNVECSSLDAKATNIQILTKEGGLKLLQIQDNGTGIRKEDMDIVCARFTTSKLQTFEDLQAITTFGFRGEALASISHVSLLTIITKTANEKCAYKASYVDSKLKGPLQPCAGNQGTTIKIENLFYNVATRRKALSSPADELSKITDVVTKYAVHNPTVGFTLKKHGEPTPQIRTPHVSTKMSNVRILYGNPVARELLEVELEDTKYKFKVHGLITNPNYSNKKLVFLLFINNRLVESSSIRKMLEELYTVYLPKKTYPWCYISLEIEPQNVDVNVHPTKHEVKFLHEDSIIEKIRLALDEKLSRNSGSRTFYVQAHLPKTDITNDVLKEVLPVDEKDKTQKLHPKQMIRINASVQKLDKFNFTVHAAVQDARDDDNKPTCSKSSNILQNEDILKIDEEEKDVKELTLEKSNTPWNSILDTTPAKIDSAVSNLDRSNENVNRDENELSLLDVLEFDDDDFDETKDESMKKDCTDVIADKARQQIYKRFGNTNSQEQNDPKGSSPFEELESSTPNEAQTSVAQTSEETAKRVVPEFKSRSINNFVREVRLTSVLKMRKELEDDCHESLMHILSELTFVGCIDQSSALIQSGVNLYLCNTTKLIEKLFYQIMVFDFANYGVIKFSVNISIDEVIITLYVAFTFQEPISLYDLAMLALDSEEAGWSENYGPKNKLAESAKDLLLEKADMLNEYFSIVLDKKGNLKSLPVLLEKYFPSQADLPLYVLRLATQVDWKSESACFRSICKETARYYSHISAMHDTHDWKYITEHVLYTAIKESFYPPKNFAHDSTVLQIASLPDLYKVFERC